ncbi:MAG: tRNA pseudouridine(55) synthase TruB [Phycisphaerae bacterium]
MFGLLNIHKPVGPSSHAIVAGVRRRVPRGVKVGHAGTLDPRADGVLVICLGPATRLAEYVQHAPKRYRTTVTLGARSTTDDTEGEITHTDAAKPPAREDIEAALVGMIGRIEQVPPVHSAVHVDGRRAYEIARDGQDVQITPRPVTIHEIRLAAYEYPALTLEIVCGSGTYIRSIARDVGETLGVGGYCRTLTRTAVGEFTLETALPPDEVDPRRDLIAPARAVSHLPPCHVTDAQVAKLTIGQRVSLDEVDLPDEPTAAEDIAVFDPAGELVAIAIRETHRNALRPTKVLLRQR